MPKIATKISFLKDNTNIKPDFCEAYTLSKQYKIYSKKPFINTTNESRVCLHIDLFSEKNILPSIRGYQYRAIFTDEAMHIKFPIIIKLKDTICNRSKFFFNNIKTYISRKMQYFWLNNIRKY